MFLACVAGGCAHNRMSADKLPLSRVLHTNLSTHEAADRIAARLTEFELQTDYTRPQDYFSASVDAHGTDNRRLMADLKWVGDHDVVITLTSNFDPKQFDYLAQQIAARLQPTPPTTGPAPKTLDPGDKTQ